MKHPTTTHPGWCSPFSCAPTDVDIQHESATVRYVARDLHFEFALVLTDDGNEPGEVNLRLTVSVDDDRHTTVSGYLDLEELDAIRSRLRTERERAQWMTAPVVRPAVAS